MIARIAIVTVLAVSAAAGLSCRAVEARNQPVTVPPQPVEQFSGTFDAPALDDSVWAVTRKNDFQESAVDVVNGRLRLRAATIGTKDDTVKFHGVRTVRSITVRQPMELAFDIDWNDQKNDSYLTAGIFLCATATDENPQDEKDWIKFEYVGVPPGRNARAWLSARTGGVEKVLYNEGWPEKQKAGRQIGLQRVRIRWEKDTLFLLENDKLLWQDKYVGPGFVEGYLYLQMSSHSNYPPREVFFDNVVFGTPEQVKAAEEVARQSAAPVSAPKPK
jgi:hypothetical protein